jgi:hypothetical protein
MGIVGRVACGLACQDLEAISEARAE